MTIITLRRKIYTLSAVHTTYHNINYNILYYLLWCYNNSRPYCIRIITLIRVCLGFIRPDKKYITLIIRVSSLLIYNKLIMYIIIYHKSLCPPGPSVLLRDVHHEENVIVRTASIAGESPEVSNVTRSVYIDDVNK